jgi:hypothetical protein
MTPIEARHMPIRGLGLLLTATALLTSCAPAPAPNADPAPSGTNSVPAVTNSVPAGCPAPGVAIKAREVDAAMGLRAMPVDMVNCGTIPYTISGYPAVRVLDNDRKPLDVKVSNGTSSIALIDGLDAAPKPVTLKPGEKVGAVLVWRNTVTDPTVTAMNGTYLEIAPAGGQPPQTVTLNGGIDLGNTGKLGVSAWAFPKGT